MADHCQNRYTAYSTKSSEEFNAASRNVKAGMIVSILPNLGNTIQRSLLTFGPGVRCSVRMDMGGNTAPELHSGLSIWNIWTILVYVQSREAEI